MGGQNAFADRTDQKLEFARYYLGERLKLGSTGTFPERAHEETVLFHVVGAKDSFLQEINHAYGLGMSLRDVNEKGLANALRAAGKRCEALEEIKCLLDEVNSWLCTAIELRNCGTHRANIPRRFYRGGSKEGSVEFVDPRTKNPVSMTIQDFLADCFERMRSLISELRKTLAR